MSHKNTDKFMLRMPDGWRDAIKEKAAANHRSMNSEILVAIGEAIQIAEQPTA